MTEVSRTSGWAHTWTESVQRPGLGVKLHKPLLCPTMPIVHTSLKCADFRPTKEVCWYSTPRSASQLSLHHSIRRQTRAAGQSNLSPAGSNHNPGGVGAESGSAACATLATERLCGPAGLCNTTLVQTGVPPCRGEKYSGGLSLKVCLSRTACQRITV